jgi:hypothetical protein
MRCLAGLSIVAGLACAGLTASDAVGMLQPQQQVEEGAGWVDYLITRVGSGATAISVDVVAGGGSATLGLDYAAPQPPTLSWNAGDLAPKTVRLPILHNPAFTWGSYLTVSLANPNGAVLSASAPTSVNLGIIDQEANPSGQLVWLADAAIPTVTVCDDAGTVAISVLRAGGTAGSEICTITLSDGEAVAGVDYTVPASTTLSWNAGEGGVKTLLVPLLPRVQARGRLTFFAGISMTTGGADPGFGSATIAIIDHLAATAGMLGCPATLTVRELSGTAQLTVNRVGGASGPAVTVHYAISDGVANAFNDAPAVAGINYTAVSGTLSWGANDVTPRTIPIPILADGVARPLLDATVTFSAPTGGLLLPAVPSTILEILDDDGASGLLGLSAEGVTVDELAGQAVLWVTRSGGSANVVSVDYACTGGTAVAGVNYTGAGNTLSWPANDATSRQIAIPILHDHLATPDLAFWVILSNPLGGAGLDDGRVPRTAASVTIGDADGGAADRIAFVSAAPQAHESGSASISVRRSGSGSGPAAVELILEDGTAQQGVDYLGPTNHVLQWADGEVGVRTLVVPLIHDGLPGPSRVFAVDFGVTAGNARTVAPYQALVTILDDDPVAEGTISFLDSTIGAVSTDGTVQLTLHRSGGSAAISVGWSTLTEAPADARPDVDYVASLGTVSWGIGDNVDKPIIVSLLDDGLPGPTRTLVVRLANAHGGCVIATRDAQVAIADAGPFPAGTIACLAASQAGQRDAGSATILVGRSGGLTGSVTVAYRTVAGTALDGRDFLPVAGTLSWASGDASVHGIVIPLLPASGVSADALWLELGEPSGGAVLGRSSTMLTLPGPPAQGSSSTTSGHCGGGGAAAFLMFLGLWLASSARLRRAAQAGDQR